MLARDTAKKVVHQLGFAAPYRSPKVDTAHRSASLQCLIAMLQRLHPRSLCWIVNALALVDGKLVDRFWRQGNC